MSLIYEEEVTTTKRHDFFDWLRIHAADEFLLSTDERYPKLVELKAELKALDKDYFRLCDLNPTHQRSYAKQLKEAEASLAVRAKELLPYLIEKP